MYQIRISHGVISTVKPDSIIQQINLCATAFIFNAAAIHLVRLQRLKTMYLENQA